MNGSPLFGTSRETTASDWKVRLSETVEKTEHGAAQAPRVLASRLNKSEKQNTVRCIGWSRLQQYDSHAKQVIIEYMTIIVSHILVIE